MWTYPESRPADVAPPAESYEARLRSAACALSRRVRVEFPLFCKDPEKVAELVALETVLNVPPQEHDEIARLSGELSKSNRLADHLGMSLRDVKRERAVLAAAVSTAIAFCEARGGQWSEFEAAMRSALAGVTS